MAIDLDKKYRDLFPEAAKQKEPEKTTDLDTQYQKLFEPAKVQAPKAEEAPKYEGPVISAYKGPEIVDRQEEPLWRKAAKFVLPKAGEEFFGLDKPMPERQFGKK